MTLGNEIQRSVPGVGSTALAVFAIRCAALAKNGMAFHPGEKFRAAMQHKNAVSTAAKRPFRTPAYEIGAASC